MFVCYIVYKLLNKNCFAYTRTAEKTYLSAFCIWCKKVNYLYTGFKNLLCRFLVFKKRRFSVYAPLWGIFRLRLFIYSLTENIKKSAQCFFAYGNFNSFACAFYLHVTVKTFAWRKHYTSYNFIAYMLCSLHYSLFTVCLNLKSIFYCRKLFA